jgi:predicted dehydrogenase
MLLWLVGEPSQVYAKAGTLKMDMEVDDSATAVVQFRSGALGQILITANCQDNRSRLEVYGTDLSAVSSEDAYQPTKEPFRLSAADPAHLNMAQREADELVPSGPQLLLWAMVEDFIGAIEEGRQPLVTPVECRRSLELITGLYRSAMTDEPVSLPIDRVDPFYSCIPPDGMSLPAMVRE